LAGFFGRDERMASEGYLGMGKGFNALLGVTYIGMQDTGYWIEIEAGDEHVHDLGLVHGGVILSLLDIAMSRAVRHGLEAHIYMPTIEINASFLRPINRGVVRTCGTVKRMSKSLARVEGEVFDAQGRGCAIGRATFISPH